MAPRVKSIAVRLIFPALLVGLFGILPVALARENKCTSGETAFMIAKRMTSDRAHLRVEDEPDFPWFDASTVHYLGGCSHDVTSWFERRTGEGRARTEYEARVRFDVIMNRWSLEDWQEKRTIPAGKHT